MLLPQEDAPSWGEGHSPTEGQHMGTPGTVHGTATAHSAGAAPSASSDCSYQALTSGIKIY